MWNSYSSAKKSQIQPRFLILGQYRFCQQCLRSWKVIAEQLFHFLEAENLLPDTQSGFGEGFSTTTALINMLDELYSTKDKGHNSMVVSLDFAQAFDSVNHQMLLAMMVYFKFDETVIDWFASYLLGRFLVTKIGGRTSDRVGRDVGLPQGSCVAPLLYILYTATLRLVLVLAYLFEYVDDGQLMLSYLPSEYVGAVGRMNAELSRVNGQMNTACALTLENALFCTSSRAVTSCRKPTQVTLN